MNIQTPRLREHHFYVSLAKFLFHHPDYGIVGVRDPIKIKVAAQYGLSPLILYGVTVAGLPIRWMTYSSVNQPKAFCEVLAEAWRNGVGLRGRPDILLINRHIATACPDLERDLASIGVQVEVAGTREKSLPASLRSCQDASRWLLRQPNAQDCTLHKAIQDLCRDAQINHEYRVSDRHRGVHSRETEDRIQQWLALPARESVSLPVNGLDWESGPWLWSWEGSLPPDQPRYFDFDSFGGGTWLLTGEKALEEIDDDDGWVDVAFDNVPEIARHLVACWPNPAVEIARSVGITLRELQWFLTEKASLDWQRRYALEDLLGIEFEEMIGSYIGGGPYVLIARKARDIQVVYENISDGGAAAPCEIVPRRGAVDPSWRYIIIAMEDRPPSIVMAQRGDKIADRLPELLMNYDGICHVVPEFYRDVVSTCAKACREPSANMREIKCFAKRYEKSWRGCAWQEE